MSEESGIEGERDDLGEPILVSLAVLEAVVRDRQYRVVTWPNTSVIQVVDAQTASCMLLVYRALSPANKVKFEKRVARSPFWFGKIAQFCWRRTLLKKE